MTRLARHGLIGLTMVDEVEGRSVGICHDGDGFLALTHTESKEFRTVAGARRWLASRGYHSDGTRMEAV